MKKKFTTIRSRITLTTITLCIFLSIAVSYISYSFYYKSVKQNMIRTAESSLTLLGSSIDSNIQDAYSFVRNCQANSFILNYLSSQGSQSARITASTYLKNKPFECVGTRREVLVALKTFVNRGGKSLLTERYKETIEAAPGELDGMLSEWVSENQVPEHFLGVLKEFMSRA